MTLHFDVRRDRQGWTVFDRWTGQTVWLNGALQAGLSSVSSEALVDRLNRRAKGGDRSVLQ